jgi:hypothetical protein
LSAFQPLIVALNITQTNTNPPSTNSVLTTHRYQSIHETPTTNTNSQYILFVILLWKTEKVRMLHQQNAMPWAEQSRRVKDTFYERLYQALLRRWA